jgi:peptide-methionine (S)-S-oxide reductase
MMPRVRIPTSGRIGDFMKFLRCFAVLAVLALVCGPAHAAKPHSTGATLSPAANDSTQVATFGLGCFWSGEVTFEGREGVRSVTSGYTGGTTVNPTYEQVGTRTTGHFESVNIVFDPRKTTYAKLLDIFWHNIDPTQGDGQFCDRGPEYRSVIFYHGERQHQAALDAKKQIEASGVIKMPIVTLMVPADVFYPAEEYHQDFYKKNPEYYHQYRQGCGRDARLMQLWGKLDAYAPTRK